jgi:hypothetical protein
MSGLGGGPPRRKGGQEGRDEPIQNLILVAFLALGCGAHAEGAACVMCACGGGAVCTCTATKPAHACRPCDRLRCMQGLMGRHHQPMGTMGGTLHLTSPACTLLDTISGFLSFNFGHIIMVSREVIHESLEQQHHLQREYCSYTKCTLNKHHSRKGGGEGAANTHASHHARARRTRTGRPRPHAIRHPPAAPRRPAPADAFGLLIGKANSLEEQDRIDRLMFPEPPAQAVRALSSRACEKELE